jgi:hypothetical protein
VSVPFSELDPSTPFPANECVYPLGPPGGGGGVSNIRLRVMEWGDPIRAAGVDRKPGTLYRILCEVRSFCVFRVRRQFLRSSTICFMFKVLLVFWPRMEAPVFLACAPPFHIGASLLLIHSSKKNYFQKRNASLQARTRAARGLYLSTGLSCTLLSYAAPY